MKLHFNTPGSLLRRGVLLAAAAAFAAAAQAGGDAPPLRLSIQKGKFSPSSLAVPAGVKFQLIVTNEDDQPAEFESFRLHREQVIVGHSSATIYLGPLKAGSYDIFDDFHPDTKGTIEAAEGRP